MSGRGVTALNITSSKGANQVYVNNDETGRVNAADPGMGTAHLFAPEKWKVSENYVTELIDYNSTNQNYSYNQVETIFEIDKRSSLIGRIELFYTRSAVTGLSGGSYIHFEPWEAYASIDRIVIEYMNKDVYTVRGEELFWDMIRNRDPQYIHLQQKNQGADRNFLQMIEDSRSPKQLVVDLQLPFEKLKKMLPVVGLPNKMRIKVTFKNLKHCIRTDHNVGSPVCSITEMFLRVHAVHLPERKTQEFFGLVKNTGYSSKISTKEFHLREIFTASNPAAGEQTWTLFLKNLKNYTYEIFIIIRPVDAVEPAQASANLDLWRVLLPDKFWLEDGRSETTNKFETSDYKGYGMTTLNHLAHPKLPVGFRLPAFYFTVNTPWTNTTEQNIDHSYGGRAMNRYNNASLKLWFAPNAALTNGAQYYVDVWACIHNNLLISKGDLRRYLL